MKKIINILIIFLIIYMPITPMKSFSSTVQKKNSQVLEERYRDIKIKGTDKYFK